MSRPVALITGASTYVGPALARRLAGAGFDLLLCAPAPDLVDELRAGGTCVAVADPGGSGWDTTAAGWGQIVAVLQAQFGRLDAAALFPPPVGHPGFSVGPLLQLGLDDLRGLTSYFDTTALALQAVIPPLQHNGGGQIVVFTSAAGARPVANWAAYGAVRAGQSFLVQAAAAEHAADRICINVIGSKNALFAGFPGAPAEAITDDAIAAGPWASALLAETPLGRLGTMQELASFAGGLLDGSNRFQTGQYFSFSGGWQLGG